MTEPINYNKKNLRKVYLEKRKALSFQELQRASEAIHENLFNNIPIQSYLNIHVFLPIKTQNEIDTQLIINTLWQKFMPVNIYIPKVEGAVIKNYLFSNNTKVEANKWGILEPIIDQSTPIENKIIDLVLIPLLIFDKRGNRVGYGKGFYDRFLTDCRSDVMKIGLSIFEPVDAIEAIEEHDIKMNFCITPKRVWGF